MANVRQAPVVPHHFIVARGFSDGEELYLSLHGTWIKNIKYAQRFPTDSEAMSNVRMPDLEYVCEVDIVAREHRIVNVYYKW